MKIVPESADRCIAMQLVAGAIVAIVVALTT